VAFALAGAKADEREVLLGMLEADPNLVEAQPNQKLWRTRTTTYLPN
jgi:hypothetical protein